MAHIDIEDDVTPSIAADVLWYFDHGGYEPGSFTRSLLGTICSADPANSIRLSLGFPGYVAACRWAREDPNGIERLREIAYSVEEDETFG